MMSSTDGTRTDEPDLTLIENTSRIKAIEEIMHRLLPLAHQAAAIQAQTEQHQLQNAILLQVERNQGGGRPLPNGRHHQDDDDDEETFPTTRKMEFSKYDGTGGSPPLVKPL
jgi:hypothetical protein